MNRLIFSAFLFSVLAFVPLAQAIPDDGNRGTTINNSPAPVNNVPVPKPAGPAREANAEGEGQTKEIKNLFKFVDPTNVGFSLSVVNSDNEKNLIIDSSNSQNNILFRAIRLIAMLVGTLAIVLYIVGAYFMIFSQGDENQLTKGKQIVLYTSLGLVLAFGAYMIVQLVMGLIYFAG